MESKLSRLGKEANEALARIGILENVSAERVATLCVALREVKLENVESFDTRFNTSLAQIQVMHSSIDLSEMNLDKRVLEG